MKDSRYSSIQSCPDSQKLSQTIRSLWSLSMNWGNSCHHERKLTVKVLQISRLISMCISSRCVNVTEHTGNRNSGRPNNEESNADKEFRELHFEILKSKETWKSGKVLGFVKPLNETWWWWWWYQRERLRIVIHISNNLGWALDGLYIFIFSSYSTYNILKELILRNL